VRHKGEDRARKAAAVHAPGAAAAQHPLGQGAGQGEALLRAAADVEVLQQLPARLPAADHVVQEGVQVAVLQGRVHGADALVFVVVVQGAQHRAVRGLLAHLGQALQELLDLDVAQDLAAQGLGHGPHLAGDGGVFVRQVVVAGIGGKDHEAEAPRGKVEGIGADLGIGVLEVDADQAADGAGALVHQA